MDIFMGKSPPARERPISLQIHPARVNQRERDKTDDGRNSHNEWIAGLGAE
jgi:hypothetical protein